MSNEQETFLAPLDELDDDKLPTNNADHQNNTSPRLKFLGITMAIALCVNAIGGWWAYNHFVLSKEKQKLDNLSIEAAQLRAKHISDYLFQFRNNLHRYTSQTTFIQSIEENNTSLTNNYLNRLKNNLPNAHTVAYFPTGTAKVNADPEAPIKFTDVDMINRAEKRNIVFPEAIKDNNTWRINLVEPIPFSEVPIAETSTSENTTKNDQTDSSTIEPVIATLFVSISADDMLSLFTSSELAEGKFFLTQQFKQGTPQIIAELGQGDSGEEHTIPIENTYWSIKFIPSDILKRQANVIGVGVFSTIALLLAASLLLCLLLTNVLTRRSIARTEQMLAAKRAAIEARSETTIVDPLHRSKKLAAVELTDGDSDLLGSNDSEDDPLDIEDISPEDLFAAEDVHGEIPGEIFRAYDIRGIVETQLTPANVVLIGQAIGSAALEAGDNTIIVGRDGRTHSPEIAEQLIEGILTTGCHVVNIGMVPSPVLYYAIAELESTNSGVIITASHNPADYNGFKIVLNNESLSGEKIQDLRIRISQQKFAQGSGREDFAELTTEYIDRIFSDVALAGEISVVIDAGNGVAGEIATQLFRELGCNVTPLFCDIDGSFPNHEPDPSVPANLQPLINMVQEVGADIGIALDGDGDRLGVVTSTGKIIWPDRLLMLLAKDIVSRNPGTDVLYDVKSSRELNNVISSYGGRPIMWKTGHSHMKAKMQETGALLGGELSGHIFIKERWYGFDDGMYAAARLLEIMSLREESLDDIFENFPELPATPEIKISIPDSKKFIFIQRLISEGEFENGRVTTIDGLRVDYPEGWGLVRVSNTSPALTLRFEGESEEALTAIQERFKQQLIKIDPKLELNF
ncbi:MAG: phosphomannomutase/phosphoglucomutase [Cellvibrionaceae bacterium]